MPTHPTPRRRELLLETMAQCLLRMVESTTVAAGIDALVGFLQGLPITWHTVDVFAEGRLQKHLASFRCPRGFAAFVTRLGFAKRPDGTYQGSFADSTLLLVKAAGSADRDRCLVCAIGLPKNSSLNDGAVLGCMAGLIHEALSRVLWFERQARADAALRMIVEQDTDYVAVFDTSGNPLVQHSPTGDDALPAPLLTAAAHAARRRSKSTQAPAISVGDEVYDATSRWITTGPPFDSRYLIVRIKRRRTAPIAVVEQLKNYGFSRRESQIAELVFSGKTNRLIADALFISLDTVKTHCRHIFGKMGIARRTEFLRVLGESPHQYVDSADHPVRDQ